MGTPILELSRAEIVQRIDFLARRRLGISGQELVRIYQSGRLEDPGRVADVLALMNLLPQSDPLLADAS